ncbi:MAG: LytR family transcriptional regulator [Actinobacteria bacterium]|nr:LytR family transcriptional regulator [Actinomycetota bacterium]
MNKTRGCFITFVILFVIALFVILFFALPDISTFFSPSGTDNELAAKSPAAGSRDYLFLGVDEREDLKEFKGRTDTIMIYHVSGWGKKDVLISIPRDTRVNLEGRGWNKINAAYVYGGEEMLKKEIYDVTGISIRRTMMLNFEGFKRVIDALGGVEITVDEPMHDPLSGSNFDPGTYIMNGEQALAFARCRKTAGGDFDRVDRQKYLISQIISQKINFSIIGKAPQLITILNEETRTDFTMADFINFGAILIFSDKDIERITIPGKTATIDGISYVVVDVDEVREFLKPYLN